MAQKVQKARYWTAVLYPESMVDDWEESISDIVQVAYEYCVHDSDKNIDGEDRKTHVHVVLAFNNVTTYNHALKVFQLLQESCSYCEQVLNIAYMHKYLIHDTDSCRKKGKFLYSPSCRISGNNFDIGSYEQISLSDKRKMCKELCDFVVCNCICNFTDFYCSFIDNFGSEYFEVLCTYSGLIERLCKGNYLIMQRSLN